jgi:CHAT domain-containing protein
MNRIITILLFAALAFNGFAPSAAAGAPQEALKRANTYLEKGQYRLALEEANAALQQAATQPEQARAQAALGNIHLLMRDYKEAEKFLLAAYEAAQQKEEKADYANSLGVLYHEMGSAALQEQYFRSALELAGNNKPLAIKIRLNRIGSQANGKTPAQLQELLNEIAAVDSPGERLRYYLNLAAIAKNVGRQGLPLARKALEKAQADSGKAGDNRLQVELLDSLADIYEQQGQDEPALALSEQASNLAGQTDAEDILINLEWRKARIYRRQGRDDQALAAFGRAVDNVQAIRMDIPVEYHDGKSSFRETLEPIYLGYAYHLLKKAGGQEGETKQRTLLLARQTVEQLKQSEMEDFLGGRCLIEGLRRSELESLDNHAAILYPIILPDRLELLVGIGKTIRQYTVPVVENQVRGAAQNLAESLRNWTEGYRRPSEDLYRWIIAPLEKDLQAAAIKTLVVVPDGVLRLVPFAALSDGRHYVVEKYAVSVSPGMSLMGGGEGELHSFKALLIGLSKPGPVVEKLPVLILSSILEPERQHAGRGGLTDDVNMRDASRRVEQLLREPGAVDALQKKLSLPGVEIEVNALEKTTQGTKMLNEQFTVESFRQQVTGETYQIIHIASHGVFSSNAGSSFLMAYDNVLKLDDLETLLKGDNNGQKTIELLTLSACETAEGDDRAPLGFTGAALKANARSALGSLWPISDEAAAKLMEGFYRNLMQHQGKAEALRQAQLELLHSEKMSHPFHWSPFILVGNWL